MPEIPNPDLPSDSYVAPPDSYVFQISSPQFNEMSPSQRERIALGLQQSLAGLLGGEVTVTSGTLLCSSPDVDSLPLAFGEVLHAARVEAGISQRKTAEMAECVQSFISDIEQAKGEPQWSTMVHLAGVFGLRLALVVSQEPPPADILNIAKDILNLNPEARERLQQGLWQFGIRLGNTKLK